MRRFLFVLALALSYVSGWASQELRLYALPPPEYGQVPKAIDALDEVNAARKAKGLKPFLRDEKLTEGARACASYRADHLCRKHTRSDFAFLPAGADARAAGCGAASDRWGWLTCCTFDDYEFAGAAWARGRDNLRYMHMFCR